MIGELLIVWSARLFVLCYFLRLAGDLLVVNRGQSERWGRIAWTAGCGLLVLHLGFAFHFVHHWSHAAAYAHTAQRTNEVIGVNWGGGVYVNYAFALLWVADVALGWRLALRHRPPLAAYNSPATGSTDDFRPAGGWPAYQWTVQAIFAVMMFNATVVFGPAFWKWVVGAAVIFLVVGKILVSRASHLPYEGSSLTATEAPSGRRDAR